MAIFLYIKEPYLNPTISLCQRKFPDLLSSLSVRDEKSLRIMPYVYVLINQKIGHFVVELSINVIGEKNYGKAL